jgi:hypothetical protein
MTTDQDVADQVDLIQKAGVTVHIRGDDRNPVIEFRDKLTRRVVGGVEMKRRIVKP